MQDTTNAKLALAATGVSNMIIMCTKADEKTARDCQNIVHRFFADSCLKRSALRRMDQEKVQSFCQLVSRATASLKGKGLVPQERLVAIGLATSAPQSNENASFLVKLDQKFLDSDLTPQRVQGYHWPAGAHTERKPGSRVVYFFREPTTDAKLVGYCEYAQTCQHVKIVWFCVPGYGEPALRALLDFLEKQGIVKVSLGVSIDENTPYKATLARVSLYTKLGFAPFRVQVSRESDKHAALITHYYHKSFSGHE